MVSANITDIVDRWAL